MSLALLLLMVNVTLAGDVLDVDDEEQHGGDEQKHMCDVCDDQWDEMSEVGGVEGVRQSEV
jgi:hypothetical protein